MSIHMTIRWNPNPFARLVDRGNEKYPFAGIMLSSFWERIKDTFFVFHGSFIPQSQQYLGILDYLFPIPRLIELAYKKIADWLNRAGLLKNSFVLSFMIILSILISLPSWIKFLATIALTIAVIPLIAIAHCIIKYVANKSVQSISSLTIKKNTELSTNAFSHAIPYTQPDLFQDVQKINMDEEEIYLRKRIYPLYKNNSPLAGYTFFSDKPDEVYGSHLCALVLCHPLIAGWDQVDETMHFDRNPTFAVIEITLENADAIEAILKTNYFRGTQKLPIDKILKHIDDLRQPKVIFLLAGTAKEKTTISDFFNHPYFDKNLIPCIFEYLPSKIFPVQDNIPLENKEESPHDNATANFPAP